MKNVEWPFGSAQGPRTTQGLGFAQCIRYAKGGQ
jgi:hypothetical protein